MGWHAARKLRKSVTALSDVIAIELLAGARALALRAPLVGSPATQAVADFVNGLTGGPGHDRFLSPEMEAVANAVSPTPPIKRLSGPVAVSVAPIWSFPSLKHRCQGMTRPCVNAARALATAPRSAKKTPARHMQMDTAIGSLVEGARRRCHVSRLPTLFR